MSTRKAPPQGWSNINLNKPEEYSSEFLVDGNRYANVTNVSTGQRQLYLVSGGFGLTNRTLIQTTNSNGSKIQGSGYNDFIRQYGQGALTNAEINSKRQANFIIDLAATPQEKQNLAKTDQYRSAISNVAGGTGTTAAGASIEDPAAVGTLDPNQNAALSSEELQRQVTELARPATKDYGDLKYVVGPGVGGDYIQIQLLEYKKSGLRSGEEGKLGTSRIDDRFTDIKGTVYLPIQSGIIDNCSVDWGQGELNPITAQFANAAYGTIAASAGGPMSGLSAFGSSMMEVMKTFTDDKVTPELRQLIVNYFTEQSVGTPGLLSRTIGGAINNNLELLFNGPTLRSFTFTFRLTPRSKEESVDIRKIIRLFKTEMHPALSDSELFLLAPNVFKIKYMHNLTNPENDDLRKGKDHPYLNRIKVCALKDFSVNYTPDGSYMTYNGTASMTAYELNMTFAEINPIYKQDYTEGEEGPYGMGW
jgi:hypothetical protein